MTINKENLDIAITVMERVREQSMPLDMGAWQDCEPREIVREEKHLCGTPCCFAGYIAVSPEFKMVGKVSVGGAPMFNSFLGDDDGKLQVNFNYQAGQVSTDFQTNDQIGLTLSTKISDRVLINGKVGVPVGAHTQTSVVGEVKVEVLLNEEGSLRGTVFNRQNEVQYSTEEEGYTQGIGLSYQVNFNNLSDLGKKLGLKKKKKSIKIDTLQLKKNKLIKFKPAKKKD